MNTISAYLKAMEDHFEWVCSQYEDLSPASLAACKGKNCIEIILQMDNSVCAYLNIMKDGINCSSEIHNAIAKSMLQLRLLCHSLEMEYQFARDVMADEREMQVIDAICANITMSVQIANQLEAVYLHRVSAFKASKTISAAEGRLGG